MAACKMWSALLLFRDAAVESWLCQRKAVPSKRFPLIPMMPTGKVTTLSGAHAGFWGWRLGCRDHLCAESR